MTIYQLILRDKTDKKININWKKSFLIDTGSNLSSNVKTYWQNTMIT